MCLTCMLFADMDYDWVSGQLFWVQESEDRVYSLDTSTGTVTHESPSSDVITHIAVDPHNG